jgi:hypothetical protein
VFLVGILGVPAFFCRAHAVTSIPDTWRRFLYVLTIPKGAGAAHVVTTARHSKGKVYHTHLLRLGYRESARVLNKKVG